MVWNSPLWYLPFIVATEIIACVLSKLLVGFDKRIAFLLSITLGCVSYRILNLHTLVFELETVIYLFPFFILGAILKGADFPNSRKKLFASIGLVMVGSVLGKVNGAPGYLSDTYNSYILFLISAMCLCIGIIFLVQYVGMRECVLNYIGKNTLVILAAHKFPVMFCSIVLNSIFHITFASRILMVAVGVIIASISIVACLMVGRIAEKICPVLIGKSPNS